MLVAAGKNGIRKAEDLKKPDAAGKPRRFGIWSVDFGMAPLAFLRKQGVAGEIVPAEYRHRAFSLGRGGCDFRYGIQ